MPDPTSSAFDHSPKILPISTRLTRNTEIRRALVSNRALIIVWRSFLVIAVVSGIILNSKGIHDFLLKLLYFTIQSNSMLALCIGYALWATIRNTTGPAPVLKGAVTVYISITGLVYNLILARTAGPPPAGSFLVPFIGGTISNDLLHIFAPIMALVDWLLFDVHGKFEWRYALRWLLYPLLYLAFVLIRAPFVTGPFSYPYLHYPYAFINVDKIGYGGVALNALIYGIAFWCIGLALVAADRATGHFQAKR